MRLLALAALLAACSTPPPTPIDELGGLEDLNGVLQDPPVELPDFQVVNYDESPRSKDDLLGHPTVVWYFPAAGTPG